MDDVKECKILVEEVTANWVKIEVEPEDVTKLLQSHDETF